MPKGYQVGAYYFPNYHLDARNEAFHGKGWSEWELVKKAVPRWEGHQQPRVPAWGYTDEANPVDMAQKIDAAADHGLDYWIFDWYWYNDGPFLERGLDEGFLGAKNNRRLKFCLMWANHDWLDIHPAHNPRKDSLLYPGEVTPETFAKVCDHVIDKYFKHPSYFKVDGLPYFSFYDLNALVQGLGGLEATRQAFEMFRDKAVKAGLPGVHINAVVWSVKILPNEQKVSNPVELVDYLGFDSITSYVWIHHVPMPKFPETEYEEIAKAGKAYWESTVGKYAVPYYPNVTMGWDASARTHHDEPHANIGYPYMPAMANNTPEAFEKALREAKAFLDAKPARERILNINAWNEWTEGSYLEPDTVNGMGYLEAIKRVFG